MEWDIAGWDTEEAKAGKQTINQRAVDDRAMKTFEKSEAEHFKQAARLDKLCPIPTEGERWHIVTEKSFNAYSFILQQLQVSVVDELYLAIYCIGEPVVRGLLQLIESGQIRKATFITSNFFKENHKAEAWATALEKVASTFRRRDACLYIRTANCVCSGGATSTSFFRGAEICRTTQRLSSTPTSATDRCTSFTKAGWKN